jgi:capsid assembly protease
MKLLDILNSPWAIEYNPATGRSRRLDEIHSIYLNHLNHEKIDLKAIEAALGRPLDNEKKPYRIDQGVAVIPIEGVIAKKMNLFSQISGGMSTKYAKDNIRQAISDPEVSSILLDVDSPGGTVDGTEELASEIYASRGVKPIVAFTDGMIASAAYWIASAADSIWISGETPWVGSIGVVTTHADYSKYEEQWGIKTTEIYAGHYKRIASEHAPLSQEGKDYLQAQVDAIYTVFANSVARNRKLPLPAEGDAISWADGKLFMGLEAQDQGLVDGVSTRDQLIDSMASGSMDAMTRRARVDNDVQQKLKIISGGHI